MSLSFALVALVVLGAEEAPAVEQTPAAPETPAEPPAPAATASGDEAEAPPSWSVGAGVGFTVPVASIVAGASVGGFITAGVTAGVVLEPGLELRYYF